MIRRWNSHYWVVWGDIHKLFISWVKGPNLQSYANVLNYILSCCNLTLLKPFDGLCLGHALLKGALVHYYGWKYTCWSTLCIYGWKHGIRSHRVWIIFFLKIQIFENHHGNTICQKNYLILEIKFYAFKVETTKFSWKFTMFLKSFYRFKTLKKNMWIRGFFVSNVHQIISIFLWILIYSTRKYPCVQNIQKIIIHIHFRLWKSNILKH
jgi:hypothetical protein